MTTLIILFDAIAYSVGLLNLFLAVLLYARDRDVLYVREFLLMLSFSAIVVTQSLTAANGGSLPAWFAPAGDWLPELGMSMLIFALPWYIHHLEPVKFMEIRDRLFLGLSAMVLLSNIALYIMDAIGLFSGKSLVSLITTIVCVVSTLYSISLGLIARIDIIRQRKTSPAEPRQALNETTLTAMRMGWFTLILLPVMLYLDFANLPTPGWPALRGLRILPMIYILWSILLMGLRIRTLLAALPSGAGIEPDSLSRISGEFQLSPRELEVLDRLIQGRTYEQIASSLFISLSTVKTHIGRIYRKTAVTNKVELIHRLQKAR